MQPPSKHFCSMFPMFSCNLWLTCYEKKHVVALTCLQATWISMINSSENEEKRGATGIHMDRPIRPRQPCRVPCPTWTTTKYVEVPEVRSAVVKTVKMRNL